MHKPFLFSDFNLELQVLIRAGEATLDKGKKTQLELLVKDKAIDWEKVYHLACVHQIRPLLLKDISGLQDVTIPTEIIQKLKADCFRISARGLANTNEMLRLLEIFRQNNIVAVPYKGAYLANKYYGDFGLREFSDIDLFVNMEDINSIKNILIREKYNPEYDLKPEHKSMFFDVYCEYNFNSSSKLYHVEPHYRSNHKYCDIQLHLSDFRKQILSDTINDKTINTLSEEAHLILTITNHGINEGWTSLKYIFDLHQILRKIDKTFDWNYTIEKFRELHILPIFLVGVSLIETVFQYSAPDVLRDLIDSSKIQKLSQKRLLKLHTYHRLNFDSQWNKFLFNIQCRTSFVSKLKMFYYQFSTPNKSEMEIIVLPKWLSFLYLFIRPIGSLEIEFFKPHKPSPQSPPPSYPPTHLL